MLTDAEYAERIEEAEAPKAKKQKQNSSKIKIKAKASNSELPGDATSKTSPEIPATSSATSSQAIKNYWMSISPPCVETKVKSSWCACIYKTDTTKNPLLYLGRIKKRFLLEEGGAVEKLEVDCCLRKKAGAGEKIYEEVKNVGFVRYDDIGIFQLKDVFSGVEMSPLPNGRWEVNNISTIQILFQLLKKKMLNNDLLYQEYVSEF